MNKKLSYSIFLLSLLILFPVRVFSQEKTMISPYIQLKYIKNTDNQRILQTALTYSMNRTELPLPGMEITFFKGGDRKEIIAKSITDSKGIAKVELNNDLILPIDKDGKWALSSEFAGNDTIEAGTSELFIKDVRLEMDLTEVDSIKTITLNAFMKENGKDKPVSGEAVKVYVPRMFSLLSIGEITLDDNGAGSLEFPTDMPGDSLGFLTVIAKFEENETFGNVERLSKLKWGVPTFYEAPKYHRALWTKTAPKWMIYTLSILLAGVWGHYLFAIISLIRIKREARLKKAREEYRI
jgi:hypothetical protein